MKDLMKEKKIGWIGTGVMGQSMARHLMDAGYTVHLYTRTQEKASDLLEAGAIWCDSPAEVARRADTVFTMVGFPKDVEAVYFGETGILAGMAAGTGKDMLLVDMTTTKPHLAERIHAAAKALGARFVDAPVSGGDVGARNGALSIMVGGDQGAVAAVMPLFQCMGKNIVHQGGPGAGQHTKMVNQIAIAGTMIGVCEAMVYGSRAGLDMETVLRSIGSGGAACWTLDNLAPRILARNFDPGFFVDHFIKDMEIALEEAARMDLSLPGLALVNQLYRSVKAQGKGDRGTHALVLALEKMSGGMTGGAV
uniref:3-hydroxyisobutyrate dehydrogenase n=1 Tax=Candidatus Kentrum eta TaxID=2126337 RepID=A0A450UA48_9GAMM|nr:MAG: 3-hydroxyisobutyrate dehydrogenase [Candidatus Kentron sp. H]VFJ89775.1 MAG: 3-hydroxyisobutyrate dehydrogenase [Candidatus Kentron sp. H]VFJ97178.1 MAG: 3-hydroxyisobutyrate dehydrogenase [Candidatus Kentron sp. H]